MGGESSLIGVRLVTVAVLARVVKESGAFVICDEVYEHLVYDGARHQRLSQQPGMAGRTVTISSLGKTFGLTGWKVGWTLAQPPLTAAVRAAQQSAIDGPLKIRRGPDTDMIGNDGRNPHDGCHMNEAGTLANAALWAAFIR